VAFVVTLLGTAWAALGIEIGGQPLAFPWFVAIGVVITLVVGGLIALVRPRGPQSRLSTETCSIPSEAGSANPNSRA
jgi:hypothetical protein